MWREQLGGEPLSSLPQAPADANLTTNVADVQFNKFKVMLNEKRGDSKAGGAIAFGSGAGVAPRPTARVPLRAARPLVVRGRR